MYLALLVIRRGPSKGAEITGRESGGTEGDLIVRS
jgi:hypothetical protein